MKILINTALLISLAGLVHAGPRVIPVTAEKPQKHIFVETSHLGEGFYAFTIRVRMEDPDLFKAKLVLQNDRGNLLSTPMLRTRMEDGTMRVYAAVHVDLLTWARVDVRDDMILYQIHLGSFKKAFEKK